MAKNILFTDGKLAARYDSDIHGDAIPENAIEVSEELFWRTINETDGIWSFVDGEIVKLPFPEKTVEQAIAEKKAEINVAYEDAMNAITSSYPASEMLSWDKQEAEARAYETDPLASTPLVDALANARGLDKEELVSRILVKADQFAVYSGMTIGKRQALEDALAVLEADPETTVEDVEAISWNQQ